MGVRAATRPDDDCQGYLFGRAGRSFHGEASAKEDINQAALFHLIVYTAQTISFLPNDLDNSFAAEITTRQLLYADVIR